MANTMPSRLSLTFMSDTTFWPMVKHVATYTNIENVFYIWQEISSANVNMGMVLGQLAGARQSRQTHETFEQITWARRVKLYHSDH